jgi:hypothetical protein
LRQTGAQQQQRASCVHLAVLNDFRKSIPPFFMGERARRALLAALALACAVSPSDAGRTVARGTDADQAFMSAVVGSQDATQVVTLLSARGFPPRFGAGIVWHEGALFVMGGMSSVNVTDNNTVLESFEYYSDVYTSVDGGVTWAVVVPDHPSPLTLWSERAGFGVVSANGKLYVYGE